MAQTRPKEGKRAAGAASRQKLVERVQSGGEPELAPSGMSTPPRVAGLGPTERARESDRKDGGEEVPQGSANQLSMVFPRGPGESRRGRERWLPRGGPQTANISISWNCQPAMQILEPRLRPAEAKTRAEPQHLLQPVLLGKLGRHGVEPSQRRGSSGGHAGSHTVGHQDPKETC